MSNFLSGLFSSLAAALISASGNAPRGSIEALVLNDLEQGALIHAEFEAGHPAVIGTFTDHGTEGKIFALKRDSAAYAMLFPTPPTSVA